MPRQPPSLGPARCPAGKPRLTHRPLCLGFPICKWRRAGPALWAAEQFLARGWRPRGCWGVLRALGWGAWGARVAAAGFHLKV